MICLRLLCAQSVMSKRVGWSHWRTVRANVVRDLEDLNVQEKQSNSIETRHDIFDTMAWNIPNDNSREQCSTHEELSIEIRCHFESDMFL